MKLKNILMSVAAMTVLFGCSDDKEPILDKPVELAPTTMSIRIDADGTIVSKAGTDETISNMYVLIFNDDATGTPVGIVDVTGGAGDSMGDGAAENVDIEVESGMHKVLVLANVPSTMTPEYLKTKSLAEIQAEKTVLSKETDGDLTMSSQVMVANFIANKRNKIGYGNPQDGDTWVNACRALPTGEVKLYRSVARIRLASLILSSTAADNQLGIPVKFELTDIFIANAKGYSQLASVQNDAALDKYLTIESAAPAADGKLWWYGTGYSGDNLGTKLKTPTAAQSAEWEGLIKSAASGSTLASLTIGEDKKDAETAREDIFYVYENEIYNEDDKGTGYQTLLVLKGNYTYERSTPLHEDDVVVTEGAVYTRVGRYYTMVINRAGATIDTNKTIFRSHKGVIRNTSYGSHITITGPGSDKPYDTDAYLYYNAKVQVADWNEPISIGGEVN